MCVRCYGKNLATGNTAQKGDAVGTHRCTVNCEPGTQLTLAYLPRGWCGWSASVESSLLAKLDGTVLFDGLRSVTAETTRAKNTGSVGRT